MKNTTTFSGLVILLLCLTGFLWAAGTNFTFPYKGLAMTFASIAVLIGIIFVGELD